MSAVAKLSDPKKYIYRVQKFADGSQYDGEWRNGKKEGRGKYTFADGSR